MKQLKPRDKITQKMTRDGAVEVNETQQTAERISSREADSDFSQPDTATAERVMEHLDAAHTRKVSKKAVKKAQEAAVLRTSTSRLQFTDEERATPELQPYIKKSEKAADKLDEAKAAIPKQKKLVKERTFEEATGKTKTRLHFEEQEKPIPGGKAHRNPLSRPAQEAGIFVAYAVELTGTQQEKIKGNLYELDYLQHFREVIEKSIPADNYTLIYEHGELTKPAGQYFDGDTDPQLGKFIRFEAQPNDPEALKSLLREQQKKRTPHTQRDFQLHIAALHDRRIEAEARRIVENIKGLGEPDSPEKNHCAVELSPYFVPLATDKDMERLLSMLPYKSLSLSTLEGRHGVYALIDKSERNKEMKKSRPSVRAQLQTEKSLKVPKKTAKSKHHELEV